METKGIKGIVDHNGSEGIDRIDGGGGAFSVILGDRSRFLVPALRFAAGMGCKAAGVPLPSPPIVSLSNHHSQNDRQSYRSTLSGHFFRECFLRGKILWHGDPENGVPMPQNSFSSTFFGRVSSSDLRPGIRE